MIKQGNNTSEFKNLKSNIKMLFYLTIIKPADLFKTNTLIPLEAIFLCIFYKFGIENL